MLRIIAYKYPNNEIRVNYSAVTSKKLRGDAPPIAPTSPLANDDLGIFQDDEEKSSPPLSLVPNSKTCPKTAGYGAISLKPSRFGINAKRQLIRSGAALEHEAKPHECLFLTGTLPGSTEDAYRAIAQYSGYIVNSLKAWIANRVPQKLDFYCWEYQKRGALHLHYCCHVPDELDRDYILNEFRDWWISCLSRVGDRSLTDLFRKDSGWSWLSDLRKVRAVAEVCRKSPARYLAKYLSKSSAPSRGSARAFTPSRWWGTSRPLKKLLESLTESVEIIVGGYFSVSKKMHSVKHECEASDSVTYRYPHKYGMGETYVCYPNSSEENSNLWNSIKAQSTMQNLNSAFNSCPPSKVLRVRRDQLASWSGHWASHLTESHQGLKNVLSVYWNMMLTITPSQSPEPLNLLMWWAAQTSNIRSLSRYTPALQGDDKKLLDGTLDDLEWAIELVASKGWH